MDIGSFETAPRILIFSIAMSTKPSFQLKSIAIWAPAFFMHNNSYSATVDQNQFAVRNSKKSPNQETVLGDRRHLEALNDTQLILNEYGGHSCSFRVNLGIIQNLQMSPISHTSFLVGTFFAVSYSKPALEFSSCR